MASHYCNQLKIAGIIGECILFGWSIGGAICAEMSTELSCIGGNCSLVIIGDSGFPAGRTQGHDADWESYLWKVFASIVASISLGNAESDEFWSLGVLQRLEYISLAAQQTNSGIFKGHADFNVVSKYFSLISSLVQAFRKHHPSSIDAQVAFLRTAAWSPEQSDDIVQWRTVANCGFQVYDVPGDHLALFDPECRVKVSEVVDRLLGS